MLFPHICTVEYLAHKIYQAPNSFAFYTISNYAKLSYIYNHSNNFLQLISPFIHISSLLPALLVLIQMFIFTPLSIRNSSKFIVWNIQPHLVFLAQNGTECKNPSLYNSEPAFDFLKQNFLHYLKIINKINRLLL